MNHILSAREFTTEWVEGIHRDANVFRDNAKNLSARKEFAGLYAGMVVGLIFQADSTRTRGSQTVAAHRLGMTDNYIDLQTSSMNKGETIEETVRTVSGQSDIVAIRTDKEGSAAELTKYSTKPVINCGDKMDHGTQALVDTYTVRDKTGRLGGHRIAFFGDLRRARAVRSSTELFSMYPGNEFIFISNPELGIPDDLRTYLQEREVPFTETNDIVRGVAEASVIIGSRDQTERGGSMSSIVLNEAALRAAPEDAIIGHSLPHNQEISAWVVAHEPRSVINEQQDNGVPVRMALYHDIMMKEYGARPLTMALPASILPHVELVAA